MSYPEKGKKMHFKREGVFADTTVTERLKNLYIITCEPVFGLSDGDMDRAVKRQDKAIRDYYAGVDAEAARLGLPNLEKNSAGETMHYGINFSTGEILSFGGEG